MTIQSDSFSPKHPVVLRRVCWTILNTKEDIPDMNCDNTMVTINILYRLLRIQGR